MVVRAFHLNDLDPEAAILESMDNHSEGSDHGHEHHDHHHPVELRRVERVGPTAVRLTLAFSQDLIRRELSQRTKYYLGAASLPGFRPGKAPAAMIEKKFGDQIRGDVLSHLVEYGTHDGIRQSKMEPISRPSVKLKGAGLSADQELEFEVEFEVEPEIDVQSYRGIELKTTSEEIGNEQIDDVLKGLQGDRAVLEPSKSEQPTAGQVVEIEFSFETTDSGEAYKESEKKFSVEVGAGKILPELDSAIPSLKVGEGAVIPVTFPKDYHEPKLSGRPAQFDIKILAIQDRHLPELSDAFAAQLKEGATLLSLRQDIRTSLEASRKAEVRKQQRGQIMDWLLDKNQFAVPRSMLESQARSLYESMTADLKRRGSKPPENLGEEELKALESSADQMVRSSLILRAICEKEKITLDEGLLEGRIAEVAQRTQRSNDDVKQILEKQGILNRIKDEILTDQVFDFLFQHAIYR